jgi:hypothetical protein
MHPEILGFDGLLTLEIRVGPIKLGAYFYQTTMEWLLVDLKVHEAPQAINRVINIGSKNPDTMNLLRCSIK